ncbi:ATP-binding cassette subfamily C protein CydD [Kribbella orskensis]|uniref:ATP-binding cassette subfamily C protein CydD n=1 Tax=Kribbella orskensis TaxID=2512216 RepID=A0ABY2BW67_9ACTN|nr:MULTISPECIES: ATP-binding cassette domain-containing protein [Kribbella]TCN44839.1 ATP-binding cassette subfamily C protein CydD [Kribbella sp. VKM Ac-2500]TCO31383.1 ATP-binding cassette subfamily C protein CydD [Kribbella orskensis]
MTSEQGGTTTSAVEAREWLTGAAAPGRRHLLLAAGCQPLETAFTAVQWAGLAWVAQGVLDGARPSWQGSGILFGGGLLAAAAAWSTARFQAVGRQRIAHAIRRRLVAGLLPAGQRHAEPDPATAALATVELTDEIADFHAQTLPQRVSAPVSMALILVITAVVQWPAAVILLLASLLIPLNMRLVGLFAKEGADARTAASTRLAAIVLDSFRGMPTLRNIGALGRRRTELVRVAGDLDATTIAVVRRASLSGAVMDVVITFSIAANATYVGLALLGYVRIGAAPGMTMFRGLLALLICPMYFQPIRAAAAAFHSKERALSAVPAISGLLVGLETPSGRGERVPPPGEPAEVALDNVCFRFPAADESTLHGVNVTVHAGTWTVVVGPSGAGKTTFLSLIAGMRPPSHGTVRWLTPTGASTPWLGGCTWIGQQTVLLPGSIGDNIRIGRPDASRSNVEQAVAAAGLAEVVAQLPQGLDTLLGEGGSGLSTGEARRIAIARAFLSDAGLWVLDEPTAHLDADTEVQIIVALRNATRGRTVIVATHSPVLARSADLLLGLADGTVHTVREASRV